MATFAADQRIGGRYRLIRKLGEGAMGVVWSARNESTDRDFALKLMLPESATRSGRMQRFLKEAKAAGRLRHKSIVEVYDLGMIEEPPFAGAPYLVMELLDGEPLDVILQRLGRLPAGTALRLVSDVARALEVAHRQGIIHRDLKPGNLFLHRSLEGEIVPKVLDFGISKLIGRDEPEGDRPAPEAADDITLVGTVLGSPAYMSPEQAAGEPDVDARSDIWALGVILYRGLTGALPFAGENFEQIAKAIHRKTPKAIGDLVNGIPAEIAAVVNRCLAKDRAERFQSARALADTLDELLSMHVLPTLELTRVVSMVSTSGGVDPTPSEHARTRASIPHDDPAAAGADDARDNGSPPDFDTEAMAARPTSTPPPGHSASSLRVHVELERSGPETRDLPPTAPSIERIPLEATAAGITSGEGSIQLPPIRPPRRRAVWIAGSVLGAVLIGMVGIAASGTHEPRASTRAGEAAETEGNGGAAGGGGALALPSAIARDRAARPSPSDTAAASTPSAAASPMVAASSAAPSSSVTPASIRVTTPTLPVPPTPRPVSTVRPTTNPSAKVAPAHEGITHAGF